MDSESLPELSTFSFTLKTTAVWAGIMALIWASPLSKEFKVDHGDRILSSLHGAFATVAGSAVFYLEQPFCQKPDDHRSWMRICVMISMGYFLVDLCSMLLLDWIPMTKLRKPDAAMIFHHVVILYFEFLCVQYDIALWFACALFINEMSVFPLNTVFFLRFNKMQDTKYYVYCGVSLVVVFFVCRMLAIPVIVYRLIQLKLCSQEWGTVPAHGVLFGFFLLYILNSLWFYKLVNGALKAIGKQPAAPDAETAVPDASAALEEPLVQQQ
jgi:hypothetical protein